MAIRLFSIRGQQLLLASNPTSNVPNSDVLLANWCYPNFTKNAVRLLGANGGQVASVRRITLSVTYVLKLSQAKGNPVQLVDAIGGQVASIRCTQNLPI